MKAVACVLVIIFVTFAAHAQESSRNWDISVWISGSTGEELTNSFGEAQLWSAGFFVGRVVTQEIGSGWRRGRLEYGVSLIPAFIQSRPQLIYGGGFEPVVLRWNSALRFKGARPYVELAGGALRTVGNLPSGDTSAFNFSAKGGGGLLMSFGDRRQLDVGLHWSHISNANLGVRNPEFNGIEVRVGFHFKRQSR